MPDTPAAPDICYDDAGGRRAQRLRKCRLTPTHRHRLLQQPQPRPTRGSKHSLATRSGAHACSRAAWKSGGEFERLTELAAGADDTADAINNTTPEPFQIETVGPGELNSRDRATCRCDVSRRRARGRSDRGSIQRRQSHAQGSRCGQSTSICSTW